jgi:hypothetical protein
MITKFELFESEKHSISWWNEINDKIDKIILDLDDDRLINLVKELIDNRISKSSAFLFLMEDGFNPPEILTLVKIRLRKIRPDIYERIMAYQPGFKIKEETQLKRKITG